MKGIYAIINKFNNKIYIGSASNIMTRISGHKYLLAKGNHGNKHLQAAYNKYGQDAFDYISIEECENLVEREEYWIIYYEAINPEKGYNKAINIQNTSGYKWTEESRKKFSESKKGKPVHSKEGYEKVAEFNRNRDYIRVRVAQYSQEGKLLNIFNSIAAASRSINVNENTVAFACRKGYISGGYQWKIIEDTVIESIPEKYSNKRFRGFTE